MQIELELDDETISIDASDTAKIGLEALIAKITEHPAAIAFAKRVGKESYFEAWSRSDAAPYEESSLRILADAWIENGQEGLMDVLISHGWDQNPSEHFNEFEADEIASAFDDVISTIEHSDLFDTDYDEIKELILDGLRDHCIDAMVEGDSSSPSDLFRSYDKIEMSFGLDLNFLSIDDLQITHVREHQFDPWTARPDANLMRMFKIFNISPIAFFDEVKQRYSADLRIPTVTKTDNEWKTMKATEIATSWKLFHTIYSDGSINTQEREKLPDYLQREVHQLRLVARTTFDIDRPAAMSMDDLFTAMTEASYGGIPCVTARFSMKDIIEGKLDEPFVIEGGLVGIHDFINGSGYMDTNKSQILINPQVGGWRTRSIQPTYDFIGKVFENTITPAINANWCHTQEDTYRSEPAVDFGYAEIWKEPTANGDVFWLSTYDKLGVQSGVYRESEPFADLQDAMTAGLEAIKPKPVTPEEEPEVSSLTM